MKLIKFTIEEMDICFSALAYMFADHEAREKYKSLLLDINVEFPHKNLDIFSDAIKTFQNAENMFLNFEIVKTLSKLEQWNNLKEYSQTKESEVYYNAFIDKITGNIDKLKDISLIEFADNKQAFLSFVNGNLRALINSTDKKRFAYWNGSTWSLLTDEETQIIYGDFIQKCNIELSAGQGSLKYEDWLELAKKITKWDTGRNTKEALDKIKRESSRIIDLKKYDLNNNIICSNDGKIINLNTGEIKNATRNDMILFTSEYNLVDKEESIKFMSEKMSIYLDIIGEERLNFILDLIAYKMLNRSLQSAIFMIGTGATGKSTFKQIAREIFKAESSTIPYDYMTTMNRGNSDASRDDILASLDNKKIAFCSEGEEEKIISSAKFKKILSHADESARKTNEGLTNVSLQNLDIIFDTNAMPSFSTMDAAISRRLIFVKFENPIPLEKRNADYYRDEILPNFDYVFSYFVYRALDMIGKKLNIPDCVKNDTSTKLSEVDSLLSFSKKIISPFEGSYIKYSEFEKEYLSFCEEEGLESVIPNNLQDADNKNKQAKRCNYIIDLLKEKEGYSNAYKGDRMADGKYGKTYPICGITFKDTNNINPFEAEIEPKEIQQEILI
ncbi:putative DNA primase/helicase [Clostridium beijerinckii]|uniref:DNA primase/helicase n=1 Tax=Clostridium beijerinckii TaxID=1520 RepID=A0AAX0B0A5_CLOBE|nr:putative DNA primase/helicase [Clostridium beijerinckii]NYC74190.1 putative DNA primase/helicase [Clostridium beijerinckii]